MFATDHLGTASPFPALVAAAAVIERMRVGTMVLNAPFWNPSLLAREVSTTDVLTGGRLELGLGAGHMKWEFDHAEIAWEPFGAEEILGTPFVLICTVEQMADRVLRNRDRYGFTYYTVHGPFMTAFAPVIERLRART